MNDIHMLRMSLYAGVLIIAIASIRWLAVHKLPKWIFVVLWVIVLCRLLVPLTIQSPLSVYNALDAVPQLSAKAGIPAKAVLHSPPTLPTAVSVPQQVSADAVPANERPGMRPLAAIWLAGAALMTGFFLTTHLRWRLAYRTALPVDDAFSKQWLAVHPTRRTVRIRQSDRLASPLTYGLWRPVIVLPKTEVHADNERLSYMLAHEMVHIRRLDVLYKWLLAAALCVHWFNPLVWLMVMLAGRDIELACDEAVVRKFGNASKSSYALALIGLEEKRSRWMPFGHYFSKHPIEERITAIMKMKIKKTTGAGRIAAIVLLAGFATVFATSAMETKAADLLGQAAFGDEAGRYADYTNQVTEASAFAQTADFAFRIDSTVFTDNHVYALIVAEGRLPDKTVIGGRIVYASHDQTLYGLKGESREICTGGDGKQKFLYSAEIAEPAAPSADPMLAAAAGEQFLQQNSLRDHEGEHLELTIDSGANRLKLVATVTRVSTAALVFHPDAARYEGDYYDTVVLTPYELKMEGRMDRTYDTYAEWDKQLYTRVGIRLDDGRTVHLSYDSGGTAYDEGYPVGMSRGQDMDSGTFYHWWNFRGWELDLSRVAAIVIDGATYRAVE